MTTVVFVFGGYTVSDIFYTVCAVLWFMSMWVNKKPHVNVVKRFSMRHHYTESIFSVISTWFQAF